MEQLKARLVHFFEGGIKNGKKKNLGVEIEHFVVDKETRRAVPYEGARGVREILEHLIKKCPEARRMAGEDFFGFETREFTITLEPAAQLEISMATREDIADIRRIYEGFREKLEPILQSFGYEVVCAGCQPVSRVRELALIPKERYRLMDAHFAKTGTGGIEMMRGSASAQVSIDFFSEEDFRRKIQAAYFLTPLFQLLNDNAEVFENRKIEGRLKRVDIWRRTDNVRTGILPNVFAKDYSFETYADYLCHMPLIFRQKDGEAIDTGFQTVSEIYGNENVSEEDILHILSMAFPDVRLKQYLEIRGADSVPLERVLAYCALLKGILYSEKGLEFCQKWIHEKGLTGEDIISTQDVLMECGWEGTIYGIPAREFAKKVIELAESEISGEEREYLAAYINLL